MAGKTGLLIALGGLTLAAHAQSPNPPGPTDAPGGKKPGGQAPGAAKPGNTGPMSPEFAEVRKAIDALTPEQRQRFVDNFKRWALLPPEERKALADRETMRRKKINEEIDRALQEAGLPLVGDQRAQFTKRYAEERRKLEEQLRQEMEAKRQPALREIIVKLQAEFSAKTNRALSASL